MAAEKVSDLIKKAWEGEGRERTVWNSIHFQVSM
jgi:hypothetical protein